MASKVSRVRGIFAILLRINDDIDFSAERERPYLIYDE